MKILIPLSILVILAFCPATLNAQESSLVNTSQSPYAKLRSTDMGDVRWTTGFWADWFSVCRDNMVPHMMGNYLNPEVSHSFRNFEIAAGLEQGEHKGPPFHDGDFYKMIEAMIVTWSAVRDAETEKKIDEMISIISGTQRSDGYIHTPVVIRQLTKSRESAALADRLDFETYNMGHLMTAACIHYRLTGKKSLLAIAIKATDFLFEFFKRASAELARNAICPSHYMGVVEMYRTTRDPRYLELAKNLIAIRGLVDNGTDDNQDRIPFEKQDKAIGHAVRANYLYAGVADVYAETGDDSLLMALEKIWQNLTETKMYITGGCGALYDGVSPDGTSYSPPFVQKVHQAYGREFQLPNLTAHNESCANIGNLLWNWRMFLATGEARFTDVMELVMYNSLLAAVSLDGKGYFYTNPLCVSADIPYTLRWSREREGYISFCNCCPPNTIRTIAEISNYIWSVSDKGLWLNFYGGCELKTKLYDGSSVRLRQKSDYPWNGKIKIIIDESPDKEFSIFLRIPGWAESAGVFINGKKSNIGVNPGSYAEIARKWAKNDCVELVLPMETRLIEANPLVEEVNNRVAVKRGPVVYCIESMDVSENRKIFDYAIPLKSRFSQEELTISGHSFYALKTKADVLSVKTWDHQLYRPVSRVQKKEEIMLIPYFAWGNRGKSDMSVWMPAGR